MYIFVLCDHSFSPFRIIWIFIRGSLMRPDLLNCGKSCLQHFETVSFILVCVFIALKGLSFKTLVNISLTVKSLKSHTYFRLVLFGWIRPSMGILGWPCRLLSSGMKMLCFLLWNFYLVVQECHSYFQFHTRSSLSQILLHGFVPCPVHLGNQR